MRAALYTGSTLANARSPGEVIVGSIIDMRYGSVCRTDCKSSSYVRFSLAGEFDIFNKAKLAAVIEDAITSRRITLDLAKTKYIDASILGLFAGIARRRLLSGASQVRIVNAADGVRRLFSICKLNSAFRLEGNPLPASQPA